MLESAWKIDLRKEDLCDKRKSGSSVAENKKSHKIWRHSSMRRMERTTHIIWKSHKFSLTFFSRSDTQWFACILINDTYLACLLVFVSPFFIGRTTMGCRSCLVAVVFIVYFHLSLLPFKSQILHNSFQGSFCCYNFHFMFSFFYFWTGMCSVRFTILSLILYYFFGFIFPCIWYFFIGNIIYMKMRHFLLVFFIFSLREWMKYADERKERRSSQKECRCGSVLCNERWVKTHNK